MPGFSGIGESRAAYTLVVLAHRDPANTPFAGVSLYKKEALWARTRT